jgi:hypothetical protein
LLSISQKWRRIARERISSPNSLRGHSECSNYRTIPVPSADAVHRFTEAVASVIELKKTKLLPSPNEPTVPNAY